MFGVLHADSFNGFRQAARGGNRGVLTGHRCGGSFIEAILRQILEYPQNLGEIFQDMGFANCGGSV